MEPIQFDFQQTLAQNIKLRRKQVNLSQLELSERAGLSPGYVNDLEQGRKWATPATLNSLADALQMEAYMLMIPEHVHSKLDRHKLLHHFATELRSQLSETIDATLEKTLTDRSDSLQ